MNNEFTNQFDTNFNFGVDSVFTIIDDVDKFPPSPIQQFFLLLDNTPFLLLDNTNLLLL